MTTGPAASAIEAGLALIESRLAGAQTEEEAARAAGSGVALSRYTEGMTDDQQLLGELTALGYAQPQLSNLLLQAQLRRSLSLWQERRALWKAQAKTGTLTPSEYQTLLEQAGLSAEAVLLELALIQSQKPAAVIQSSEIGIRILAANIIGERPQELTAEISLRVLSAVQAPPAPEGIQPAQISLTILSAERAPEVGAAAPAQISLEIIEAQEA